MCKEKVLHPFDKVQSSSSFNQTNLIQYVNVRHGESVFLCLLRLLAPFYEDILHWIDVT